jgi:small subunit ribosomal protein S13
MYLLRTEIPSKKLLFIGLQKIFGIGKKNSIRVLKYLGVSRSTFLNSLSNHKIKQLIKFIDKTFLIGKDLKDLKITYIENEFKIKSYLGQRIRFHLPRRGQRTHTNARTIKKIKN